MLQYFIKAFQKFGDFKGRANRSEYWYFILMFMILYYGLIILFGMTGSFLFGGLAGLVGLVCLVPNLAVGVRRLHDSGNSGWFLLVPFYNLYLLIIEGTRGPNKYGADPNNPHSFDFDEINGAQGTNPPSYKIDTPL